MKFLTKYLLLLIVLIGSGKFSLAQDSSKTGSTAQIVMTKTELQSFLNKIAELKRQQIARQNTAKPESGVYRNAEFYIPGQQYRSFNEQQLFKELELINARLETLMLRMEALKFTGQISEPVTSSGLNLYQRPPQIRVEPNKRPVIIQQDSPPQVVYLNPAPQYNPAMGVRNKDKEQSVRTQQANDSSLMAGQNEQFILRSRIRNLENEMSLSKELLKGAGNDEKNKYNEDISNLSAQIDALSSNLEQKNREADSIKIKRQNNLSNILKDFSYNIYFDNNSTMIPSSDYSKMQEIVNIAKQHPQIPVVLRGFASKSGNPQYNDKISFQRAASVKEWLLENGLTLKDIITLHHGVDKSVDASRARRVEITFRVRQ